MTDGQEKKKKMKPFGERDEMVKEEEGSQGRNNQHSDLSSNKLRGKGKEDGSEQASKVELAVAAKLLLLLLPASLLVPFPSLPLILPRLCDPSRYHEAMNENIFD